MCDLTVNVLLTANVLLLETNSELNNCSDVNLYVSSFLNSHDLVRCDSRSRYYGQPNYVNFALITRAVLTKLLLLRLMKYQILKYQNLI